MREADADARPLNELVRLPADQVHVAKQAFVAMQFKSAKGPYPQIPCGCGRTIPLRFAIRCLYCGEYYCEACAEVHFGETREEYRRRHKQA